MIFTLIYSSNTAMPAGSLTFSEGLKSIRAEAETRNNADGITGFLFFFDNKFVQILEGEFEAVTKLFAGIRRDARHENPRIIWCSEDANRAFESWSMDCSMAYVAEHSANVSVKLSFLTRFISDTSQQSIKLRDLLVDIASAMQRWKDFPPPRLIYSSST